MNAEQRQEKLSRAREKLRKFQARQGSRSSLSRAESTDSIPESTKSDGRVWRQSRNEPQDRPPSVAASLPPGRTGFHHDDQRSPFQRVRGSSVSSESASTAALSPPQFQMTGEKDGDDDSTPRQEDYGPPALTNYFSGPSDFGGVNFGSELPGEIPVAAGFQTQAFPAMNGGPPTDSIASASITPASAMSTPASVAAPATPVISQSDDAEKRALEAQLAKLNGEFSSLHSHYGQLHAAYTAIAAQAGQGSEKESQLSAQLQQQLQTMSVLVEEKAEIQSQLRQAMELANQKHQENEQLSREHKAISDRLKRVEQEAAGSAAGSQGLEATLGRQTGELSKQREENARLEARLVELAQDRSETQARLRMKSKEHDALLEEMNALRKEMHMKEIYVRQLTAAGAQPHLHQELEARVAELTAQVEEAKRGRESEITGWKAEAEEARSAYETYGRQLNQKLVELSAGLGEERELRVEAESRLRAEETRREELEAQLKERTPASTQEDSEPDADLKPAQDRLEIMELQGRLQQLEMEMAASGQAGEELRGLLQAKEEEMGSLRRSLGLATAEKSRLEMELEAAGNPGADSAALLTQLESERATVPCTLASPPSLLLVEVSRAVAQNRELKDQLAELQEKFVAITQANAETVTQLDSVRQEVERLRRQPVPSALPVLPPALDDSPAHQMEPDLDTVSVFSLDESARIAEAEAKKARVEYEEKRPVSEDELRDKKAIERLETIKNREIDDLKYKVKRLKEDQVEISGVLNEVNALRGRLADAERTAAENVELRRIVEHNAADENHNNIYVELQQALDRITSLSNENEGLRRAVADLEQRPSTPPSTPVSTTPVNGSTLPSTPLQSTTVTSTPVQSNGDDHGSLCSDHHEERRVEELRSSLSQLESRFTRAMHQNADLSDQNQQLEHLITQLQSETDTIGEYITIYQHQRKNMRTKLQEREEQLARLSHQKEEYQEKLSKLEDLVMRMLGEKGALKTYYQLPPTHARPSHGPPSVTRTDGEVLSPDSAMSETGSETAPSPGPGSEVDSWSELAEARLVVRPPTPPSFVASRTAEGEDPTAERILRLLSELKKPEEADKRRPTDRNLHCKHCTGKIITV